jgi:DNA-binding response OmpR family regulator
MDTPEDILVVDDDIDMVEVVLVVLAEAGYAARGASNGVEALEAVRVKRPALVLLDMIMPVMDGWACGRELRARYGQGLPIVVVSAAEHVGVRSEEIGADEILPKPFELSELLEVVGRYCSTTQRSTARM